MARTADLIKMAKTLQTAFTQKAALLEQSGNISRVTGQESEVSSEDFTLYASTLEEVAVSIGKKEYAHARENLRRVARAFEMAARRLDRKYDDAGPQGRNRTSYRNEGETMQTFANDIRAMAAQVGTAWNADSELAPPPPPTLVEETDLLADAARRVREGVRSGTAPANDAALADLLILAAQHLQLQARQIDTLKAKVETLEERAAAEDKANDLGKPKKLKPVLQTP
jgi:hypothetical protein